MLNFHIVFVNFMQIHNCEAAYYVLKQNHNGHVITDSLLLNTLTSRIRYHDFFCFLCSLPSHTTHLTPTSHLETPSFPHFSFPAPSLTQAGAWRPYVTWQARPSKWWLYLNVDEREMQTAVVFVNGVLFGWGGWGVWSWLADVKQRREKETCSRDNLTTLSGRPVDGHCGSGLSPLLCVTPDSRVLSHLAARRHHLRSCPK